MQSISLTCDVLQLNQFPFQDLRASDLSSQEDTAQTIRDKQGLLKLWVLEAFIDSCSVDAKLRPFMKPGKDFEKLFSIYLKLHSTQKHFKSSSYGKLISHKVYKDVIIDKKVASQENESLAIEIQKK